jgi:hypothetical protein
LFTCPLLVAGSVTKAKVLGLVAEAVVMFEPLRAELGTCASVPTTFPTNCARSAGDGNADGNAKDANCTG